MEQSLRWNAAAEEKAYLNFLTVEGMTSLIHARSIGYVSSDSLVKAGLIEKINWTGEKYKTIFWRIAFRAKKSIKALRKKIRRSYRKYVSH